MFSCGASHLEAAVVLTCICNSCLAYNWEVIGERA